MKLSLCATCEYLGDAYMPVVDYRTYDQPKMIGFTDRYNGQPTDNPARHCNHEKRKGKVAIYEFLEHPTSCLFYKERTWERPVTCGECERKINFYSDGSFTCSGYPFVQRFKAEHKACINGKVTIGSQIRLF